MWLLNIIARYAAATSATVVINMMGIFSFPADFFSLSLLIVELSHYLKLVCKKKRRVAVFSTPFVKFVVFEIVFAIFLPTLAKK